MRPVFNAVCNAIGGASLPELSRVLARFPLAAICALLLTLFMLLDLHKPGALQPDLQARLPIYLSNAFLWALAAALASSAMALTRTWSWGLAGVGSVVLAVLIGFADALDLNAWLLHAALALSVGLAVYLRLPGRNATLWLFNHHLWLGALIAFVAALMFAGGVSLILESLRYLFGIAIPGWMHEKVWIVTMGLVAPFGWLALVPTDLDAVVPEGEQHEFTSRAVGMLVRYVLVPLLVVFAVILHAYAIKIAVAWSVPKGRLGYMVLTFGAVLALTAFAAFPTRHAGGWLVDRFWRYWPWLLAVPTVLLFIAGYQRIAQYGLTERRYFVMMAGLWFIGLIVTQGQSAERRDLRWPMALLAAMFVAAALGPWGMIGASVRSQVAGLKAQLTMAGVVRDGRLIDKPEVDKMLPLAVRRGMLGSIQYLRNSGRLHLLRPLFAGALDDPFTDPRLQQKNAGLGRLIVSPWAFATYGHGLSGNYQLANAIQKRLGLSSLAPGRGGTQYLKYYVRQPIAIDVDAKRRLIGVLSAYQRSSRLRPVQQTVGAQTFAVSLENGGVNIVETKSGRFARFELEGHAQLRAAMVEGPVLPGAGSNVPLRITRAGGDLDADLYLVIGSGRRGSGDEVKLTNISFWLAIAR